MVQELRVLENTVSTMKHEFDDLKNKIGFKASNSDSQSFSNNIMDPELSSTSKIKQMMDDKFKSLKKSFEQGVDQYANDIKSLEHQLVKFEKDISTKIDRSYMDTVEASLNALIKQSKGSNSITGALKSLSDDILTIKDRLEFNSEKYESAMEDLYRKVGKYDEESQRFLDELEEVDRYKAKNKVLQSKIDKLFALLKQHAFDPDSLPESLDGKVDIEMKDVNEVAKVSSEKRKSMMLTDIGSKKQIEAIHAMYISLESEIEELKRRMDEKDFATDMVEKSAIDIAQGKKPQEIPITGSARDRSIHRIMNVEFMGMKQLIGKHQLSINKLEQRVRDLEEYKSQNNITKFTTEQQKQSDALQAYIKEADEYNSELFRKVGYNLKSIYLDPRYATYQAKL